MKELFDLSFSGANIIPTALLCFSFLYWIIVILGAIDIDALDVNVDIELELDTDVDTNIESSGGESTSVSWMNWILKFLGISSVPLMVWISIFALISWTICLPINKIFGIENFLLGALVFIASCFPAMFVAKLISFPIGKFFSKLTDELTTDLIGKIGEIKLPTSERTSGQAIVKADGRTHVITVNADQKLNKGTQVLIIDHLEEKDLYVVEPYSN